MSASKYTEGDLVRIRKGLPIGVDDEGYSLSESMAALGGSVQTIQCVWNDKIHPRYFLVGLDGAWSDAMFEPVRAAKFKVGDVVQVRDGLQIGKLYSGIEYLDDMDAFLGKPWTVLEVDSPDEESSDFTYLLSEYWFSETMLEPAKAENDPIDPNHYRYGKIECIDAIETVIDQYPDQVSAFLAGQVIKYIWRAPLKHAYLQDLKKIRWYLNRLIEHAEKKEGEKE